MKAIAIIVITLLLPGNAVLADKAYRWVDDEGVVNFGGIPPNEIDSSKVYLPKFKPVRMRRMDYPEAVLDCPAAVASGQRQVIQNIQRVKDRFLRGGMSRYRYERELDELWDFRKRISNRECRTATGDIRSFYLCLSDGMTRLQICCIRYYD